MMSEQQNGTSKKKFLYNDPKKERDEEDKQFHSRGYHPLAENKLIDLEKVWSVKDLILDDGFKPLPADGGSNANTSYYSRHGQYKNNKNTEKSTESSTSPSMWNPKNENNNRKIEDNASSSFDF